MMMTENLKKIFRGQGGFWIPGSQWHPQLEHSATPLYYGLDINLNKNDVNI
jgi:hypothetical protein